MRGDPRHESDTGLARADALISDPGAPAFPAKQKRHEVSAGLHFSSIPNCLATALASCSLSSEAQRSAWAEPQSVPTTQVRTRQRSGVRSSPWLVRLRSRPQHPERRDLFLCHAREDRNGCATELFDLLKSNDATVWFSEKDVGLGKSLLREIDRGLVISRVGVVLVTPALLTSLAAEGIADKELSALLATDRVIPVAHGTAFDALRDVSPLLASRSGLDTAESSLEEVVAKIAAAAALAENDS